MGFITRPLAFPQFRVCHVTLASKRPRFSSRPCAVHSSCQDTGPRWQATSQGGHDRKARAFVPLQRARPCSSVDAAFARGPREQRPCPRYFPLQTRPHQTRQARGSRPRSDWLPKVCVAPARGPNGLFVATQVPRRDSEERGMAVIFKRPNYAALQFLIRLPQEAALANRPFLCANPRPGVVQAARSRLGLVWQP